MKNGEMDGCGKWVMGDGGVYSGNMENGQMHGTGVFTSANKLMVRAPSCFPDGESNVHLTRA